MVDKIAEGMKQLKHISQEEVTAFLSTVARIAANDGDDLQRTVTQMFGQMNIDLSLFADENHPVEAEMYFTMPMLVPVSVKGKLDNGVFRVTEWEIDSGNVAIPYDHDVSTHVSLYHQTSCVDPVLEDWYGEKSVVPEEIVWKDGRVLKPALVTQDSEDTGEV